MTSIFRSTAAVAILATTVLTSTTQAGGLFGEGAPIGGDIGNFLDRTVEQPLLTPLAKEGTVAATTAVGGMVGTALGAPDAGAAVGDYVGQQINQRAAGQSNPVGQPMRYPQVAAGTYQAPNAPSRTAGSPPQYRSHDLPANGRLVFPPAPSARMMGSPPQYRSHPLPANGQLAFPSAPSARTMGSPPEYRSHGLPANGRPVFAPVTMPPRPMGSLCLTAAGFRPVQGPLGAGCIVNVNGFSYSGIIQ